MDQEGAELIARMKSSVQAPGSSAQDYEDTTLMRFLVARSMNPEKAAKMFVQWQKWRAEIAPQGFIPDSEAVDELDARKVYLEGPTEGDHLLFIIKASKHYPAKDQLQFKSNILSYTSALHCTSSDRKLLAPGRRGYQWIDPHHLVDVYEHFESKCEDKSMK